MNLSELISVLEERLNLHGDVPVYIADVIHGGECHEIAFDEQVHYSNRSNCVILCTDDPANRRGYGR